jgi:hypothetical protein
VAAAIAAQKGRRGTDLLGDQTADVANRVPDHPARQRGRRSWGRARPSAVLLTPSLVDRLLRLGTEDAVDAHVLTASSCSALSSDHRLVRLAPGRLPVVSGRRTSRDRLRCLLRRLRLLRRLGRLLVSSRSGPRGYRLRLRPGRGRLLVGGRGGPSRNWLRLRRLGLRLRLIWRGRRLARWLAAAAPRLDHGHQAPPKGTPTPDSPGSPPMAASRSVACVPLPIIVSSAPDIAEAGSTGAPPPSP